MVATNWLTIADQTQNASDSMNPGDGRGIFCSDCIKLGELHSHAVDYPKSGQPVGVKDIPKPSRKLPRPDWMRPETVGDLGAEYYESQTALGRLFRAITLPVEERRRRPRPWTRARPGQSSDRRRGSDSQEDLQSLFARLGLDDDDDDDNGPQAPVQAAIRNKVREYIQFRRPSLELVELVRRLHDRYVGELQSICVKHTLTFRHGGRLTEEEVMTGTITQKTTVQRRRKEMTTKMRETTDIVVRRTKQDLMGGEEVRAEESLKRAWTAWQYTLTKGQEFGARSFGFVCLLVIFEAMKEMDDMDRRRAQEMWY